MVKSYALWVVPGGTAYHSLKNQISELSKEYNTVDFEPHVTIIGGLAGEENKLVSKMEELASAPPFEISLNKIGDSDEYFKCIFLECERNKELMDLNRKARVIFNHLKDPEFKPHLSLLYAELKPELIKKIVDELKPKYSSGLNFGVADVRFMLTAQHPAVELKKFELRKK